ncbi:MAG: XrtA/PEP-CTERM system TPR-repeat protein PrsT [Pseudomonadota bacterium]
MPHRTNQLALVSAVAGALIFAAGLSGCEEQASSASLIAQARQYQQKGDFNAALIQLKNAVESNSDDPEARYLLAVMYTETGNGQSAEKEARRALSLNYPAEKVVPVLGKAMLLQGQFQKVLDETQKAAAHNSPELLCVRADAYLAMDKRELALQLYNRVLQIKPEYATALIGLGRVAYMTRDVDAARQYAEHALTADPKNTDALMFKGDLLRAQNQSEQALKTYDQVLAINPTHRTAHVEKAYLEIALGKFAEAQANLTTAKENTPNSLLVTYTQALLDFSQGKNAAAQESLQTVLHAAPEHMPSVLLAGAVNLSLGSLPQAEQNLRQYMEKNPDNLYARKMLASTLLRSGRTPDALNVLEPALKNVQQDAQLLALAGESYMQVRDFNKATQYFEQASGLEPKAAHLHTSLGLSKLGKGDKAQAISEMELATRLDAKSEQAGLALVRTELSLQHFDNAYAAVLALEKALPDNAAVQDLKGMASAGKQDTALARASFEKALALQPSYFPAAANLAQLAMNAKNPAAAKQHLLDFLGKNSKSIEAMTALATLAVSERKPDEATQWLEQASAENPDAVVPVVRLLTHYLLIGQNQKAITLARLVQVNHPDNPDLLDLLGKSQLANGERVGALESYKKLAAALPRSAHVQMQLAALQILLNNTAVAEDHLKTALALQPDFPAAQLAHAELYVRKGSHELALMIARKLQRKYPQSAAGFQLEGDVLMGQKKADLALPAYEQAFGYNRSNELLIKIANALRANGKDKEADRRLTQWLQQYPQDIRTQLYKAETLLADKQYKQAATYLEATVKQYPTNIVALNNLALAYQQLADPRAQATAEAAYKLASDQPVIMDTLGWILIEQGDTARGLPLLQKANVQAPDARDIRYHMAVGLYKNGDKAAARRELEVLLSGNMQFAQADGVRALLKQLQ